MARPKRAAGKGVRVLKAREKGVFVPGRVNGEPENSVVGACALHVGVAAWRLVWLERSEPGGERERRWRRQRPRHPGLCELQLQNFGFILSQVGICCRVLTEKEYDQS